MREETTKDTWALRVTLMAMVETETVRICITIIFNCLFGAEFGFKRNRGNRCGEEYE